jgi:hypothetical protein
MMKIPEVPIDLDKDMDDQRYGANLGHCNLQPHKEGVHEDLHIDNDIILTQHNMRRGLKNIW